MIKHKNNEIYVGDLINCYFINKKIIIKINRKLLKKLKLKLGYKIKGYTLDYYPNKNIAFAETIKITESEFEYLTYKEKFENSDNNPVHNTFSSLS